MNCVIKNFPEITDQDEKEGNTTKLVKIVFEKALVTLIVKVKRHPARKPGGRFYDRFLKIIMISHGIRNMAKKAIRLKRKFVLQSVYVGMTCHLNR